MALKTKKSEKVKATPAWKKIEAFVNGSPRCIQSELISILSTIVSGNKCIMFLNGEDDRPTMVNTIRKWLEENNIADSVAFVDQQEFIPSNYGGYTTHLVVPHVPLITSVEELLARPAELPEFKELYITKAAKQLERITIADKVLAKLLDIVLSLQQQFNTFNQLRVNPMLSVAKAHAYLSGRKTVELEDLRVFANIWTYTTEKSIYEDIVDGFVSDYASEALPYMETISAIEKRINSAEGALRQGLDIDYYDSSIKVSTLKEVATEAINELTPLRADLLTILDGKKRSSATKPLFDVQDKLTEVSVKINSILGIR